MLTFPNAKINLGLNITEKRPDGYHNLETIFYPIPVEDALEINPLREGDGKYCLHQAGMEIAGEAENNLVVKAYKLLDGVFDLPPVDIHLFKHIPSGAGLGGGSADAAFMLKMLNEKFGLGLSTGTLEEYAARLGADCAFFPECSYLCGRHRKCVLACILVAERVSALVGKTGYIRFHTGCFLTNKAAPSGTVTERYGAAAR